MHLYCCFMDRDLGLIHVRVQTWFALQIPRPISTVMSGSPASWRCALFAAPSTPEGFAWTRDLLHAQRLANRFSQLNWPQVLNRYASRILPQLDEA